MKKLTILVPVYNEERTLNILLGKLSKIMSKDIEVLIVNDGSKDGSQSVIDKFVKGKNKNNVRSILHPKNKGKGAAIQTGLAAARGKYFVIQDADLEYDPADIPKLIDYASSNEIDAVYGSRFMGTIKGMATANYYANKLYNFILRRMYKTEITDMHTCYKMVRTDLMREIKITSNGFGYAPELVSKLLGRGIEIAELPVKFKGRTRKDGKKIDVLDGVECILSLLHYRYGKKVSFLNLNNVRVTAKFLVVGSVGFVTNYSVLTLLSRTLNDVVAELIAVAVSLQVTFVFHDRWTYSHVGKLSNSTISRYLYYIPTNAMGGAVTAGSFALLHNILSNFWALVIGTIIGLIWNFAFNIMVTWRVKK